MRGVLGLLLVAVFVAGCSESGDDLGDEYTPITLPNGEHALEAKDGTLVRRGKGDRLVPLYVCDIIDSVIESPTPTTKVCHVLADEGRQTAVRIDPKSRRTFTDASEAVGNPCGIVGSVDVKRIFGGPVEETRDGFECTWNVRDRYWVVFTPLRSGIAPGPQIFRSRRGQETAPIRLVRGVGDEAYSDSDAENSQALTVREGDFVFIVSILGAIQSGSDPPQSFDLPSAALRKLTRFGTLVAKRLEM